MYTLIFVKGQVNIPTINIPPACIPPASFLQATFTLEITFASFTSQDDFKDASVLKYYNYWKPLFDASA